MKIDKNIPPPGYVLGGKHLRVVSKMDVNDSVLVERAYSSSHPVVQGLRQAGKQLGYKMMSRKSEDGGYRIWRIK